MAKKIAVTALANAVMKEMEAYASVAAEEVKEAVKAAGATVKKEIQATAPKASGDYAKSWTVKTVKDTAHSLELTVHSRNRYQLAHLLEFGHAKRGGGRVPGKSHIAPAEEKGIQQLEEEIVRRLQRG